MLVLNRLALRRARERCKSLASAKLAAVLVGDRERVRYFEHELDIAKTRRDALERAAKLSRPSRAAIGRALLIAAALAWGGLFFFFLT